MTTQWDKAVRGVAGVARDIIGGLFKSRSDKRVRNEFDGGRQRRRLKFWLPTQNTVNTILSSSGDLLRARCRDALAQQRARQRRQR